MSRPQQSIYKPMNPHKYKGDPTKIMMRSSWERRFAKWCDTHESVVQWSSEELVIPYISPVDNRPHRYFPDFEVKIRDKNGNVVDYIVEIKPLAQTMPPKDSKRNKKRLLEETATYAVNAAKWKAAETYVKQRGKQFIIITEKTLGI